jgi:hypothetical protein
MLLKTQVVNARDRKRKRCRATPWGGLCRGQAQYSMVQGKPRPYVPLGHYRRRCRSSFLGI